MLEKPTPPLPESNPISQAQQAPAEQDSSPTPHDASSQLKPLPEPAAASSPQQENPTNQTRAAAAAEIFGSDPGFAPMLYLSESLQESLSASMKPGSEEGGLWKQTEAPSNIQQADAGPTAAVEPQSTFFTDPGTAEPFARLASKPKMDKLARLKELGLDPPPVAKLCANAGDFILLDPASHNPGRSRFFF